jgi:ubiquinol-cytochrome c reductase cytochrome b subunit
LLARNDVPEAVPIFIIPGLTVLVFFAMPWIGKSSAGRVVNAAILVGVLTGLVALTWQSFAHDAHDANYRAALQAGEREAERVKQLAVQPSPEEAAKGQPSGDVPRIPASGARTLLRDDPKTQGPRLFNRNCASCHDYSGPAEYGIVRPEKGKATAADLNGFAGQQWLSEFLTVKGISSDKFFGNTKFRRAKMYGFVKETFADYDDDEKKQIIAALAHEAQLKRDKHAADKDITAGAKLIGENCAECHTFHGKGTHSGPDLTGYGSREWLIGMISNPAHARFYGKSNDRMPAFVEWPDNPRKNILSQHDLELLVDWLREEWYEPKR